MPTDQVTHLSDLCQVVNGQDCDVNEFCRRIQKDFNRQFWVIFTVCDVNVEPLRDTIVSPYHSVIKAFLSDMSQRYETGTSDHRKIAKEVNSRVFVCD